MKAVRWVLLNFGALIVFQLTKHFLELKWAIAISMAYAVAEILWLKSRRQTVSPFMLFSLAVVLVFGGLDLWLENEFFMKLESGLMNLMMAGVFGISLFREKSVVEELAESQGRIHKDTTADKTFFFRVITTIWFLYYVLRAVLFTWVNFTVSGSESLIVKTLFGTASFYVLLAASLGLSRQLWDLLLKLHLMPSTRQKSVTETSIQRP